MCLYVLYFSYLDWFIYTLLTLIPLLIAIAFFTLAERKGIASVQRRLGPNIVGIWGVLQPFADGLKLISKEIILPTGANKFLFIFASILSLFLSFLGWVALSLNPFHFIFVWNSTILYVLIISSTSVYGILLAGWSSNSKYALFGSLRSVAQMISYEVSISIIILPIVLLCGSLSISKIILTQMITVWFFFPLFPLTFIFFISMLAETNRIPFDLPEAEAELVAGYNVEYSGFTFASFFLAEYSNILLMCSIFVLCFFGGGDLIFNYSYMLFFFDTFFALKLILFVFLFVFLRANLPRFRFDQLMYIGWKIFLPLNLGFLVFYPCFLLASGCLYIGQLPHICLNFNFITCFSSRF